MNDDCWLWWSSGKDSAWALHELRKAGRSVTRLVTTLNREVDRVAIHGVRRELLEAQAIAADVPLLPVPLPHPCTNEEYEAAVAPVLSAAREARVARMAFGDLFLEDVRAYRVKLLEGSGIEPEFPLWERNTDELARTMLGAGLDAWVTCVDTEALPASVAGERYDTAFLRKLPDAVDRCGENGEFHTFACAGPMFRRPIPVSPGEIVHRERFVFADLLPSGGTRLDAPPLA